MAKYVPRETTDNVNVSRDNPLGVFIKALIGLSALMAITFVVLVTLSEVFIRFMPERVNFALAKIISERIDTPEHLEAERERIQQILNQALAQTRFEGDEFRLEILETDEKNAMAFPGRTIAITTELLKELKYENELVMILGHEIGHYHNNDHLRSMSRAGILMGLVGLLEIGGAGSASSVISGTTNLFFGQYSRHQETMADEFGLTVLDQYYGHVDGAVNTFEVLRQANEKMLTLNGILSTHPITDQRMEHLEKLITQMELTDESDGLIPFEFNPEPPDDEEPEDDSDDEERSADDQTA